METRERVLSIYLQDLKKELFAYILFRRSTTLHLNKGINHSRPSNARGKAGSIISLNIIIIQSLVQG